MVSIRRVVEVRHLLFNNHTLNDNPLGLRSRKTLYTACYPNLVEKEGKLYTNVYAICETFN